MNIKRGYKEMRKNKSNIKAGEPLSFYETQELQIIKNTVTHKGVAYFCCKEMKKACEPYDTGKKQRYDRNYIIADSSIYERNTNKIGVKTHTAYNYDPFDGGHNFYNYVEFKYCPFCGTKINGYVDVE